MLASEMGRVDVMWSQTSLNRGSASGISVEQHQIDEERTSGLTGVRRPLSRVRAQLRIACVQRLAVLVKEGVVLAVRLDVVPVGRHPLDDRLGKLHARDQDVDVGRLGDCGWGRMESGLEERAMREGMELTEARVADRQVTRVARGELDDSGRLGSHEQDDGLSVAASVSRAQTAGHDAKRRTVK